MHTNQGSLLELERELNDSSRKSTKAFEYLTRLHLGESQEAAKTMNEAHAETFMVVRLKASTLAPKQAKCKPERPRKVVEGATLIDDSGGATDNVVEEECCDSQERSVGAAPEPAKLKLGRSRKVAEEETAAMEESGETGENSAEGRKGDAFDSEEQPLARKNYKQLESTN
ncbi:hypothetical protein CBR_g57133 [Chara braunii]|uniref:Uncharacterized protein n=1 Tax=Chara braunii TaxID=69332 RepID=A0A388ME47_CHABU|nr:hypothetical protein CBR_g57133 [Chara braunii]|eukprot:GBG92783.1 hypothetical protein CBR_g57133 [Chara braunii]